MSQWIFPVRIARVPNGVKKVSGHQRGSPQRRKRLRPFRRGAVLSGGQAPVHLDQLEMHGPQPNDRYFSVMQSQRGSMHWCPVTLRWSSHQVAPEVPDGSPRPPTFTTQECLGSTPKRNRGPPRAATLLPTTSDPNPCPARRLGSKVVRRCCHISQGGRVSRVSSPEKGLHPVQLGLPYP